jgi:hypothetical protein
MRGGIHLNSAHACEIPANSATTDRPIGDTRTRTAQTPMRIVKESKERITAGWFEPGEPSRVNDPVTASSCGGLMVGRREAVSHFIRRSGGSLLPRSHLGNQDIARAGFSGRNAFFVLCLAKSHALLSTMSVIIIQQTHGRVYRQGEIGRAANLFRSRLCRQFAACGLRISFRRAARVNLPDLGGRTGLQARPECNRTGLETRPTREIISCRSP